MSRPARSSTTHAPAQRRLRVFAFDPGVRAQLETLAFSELTLDVLWENDLDPGPIGEYLEVVDYDPASRSFYAPVDLNDKYILAQNGLSPSEGGPQLHQQMVYAVAMNTIDHFERALGRVAQWAPRIIRRPNGTFQKSEFVQRLRIYPHALREANAYYSPAKKSLLFGYFPARGLAPGQSPGGTVFTCLSYDIVAHETTHALLDGLHPSFNEPTNPDVHALHEGFADVVALLQRFAHPELLEPQIARTRGNLEQQNMLGELGQQFGQALGMRGALRSALGDYKQGPDGVTRWEPTPSDPRRLAAAKEPHDRGAVLLAAVFRAFLDVYKMRSADLFRIASGGTGVVQEGAIHPDLVRRLAREASSAAEAVLTMCIRGLDYCPPVDVDFGTYLRAVITADTEVWPHEKYAYRLAFIDAFRRWGIYPEGVRSMAECDLRYPLATSRDASLRCMAYEQSHTEELFKKLIGLDWGLDTDRRKVFYTMDQNSKVFHKWLTGPSMRDQLRAFGLTLDHKSPASVYQWSWRGESEPTLEVHSVRVARRRGFRDAVTTDIVVEVRQRRRGYFDRDLQAKVDKLDPASAAASDLPPPDFRFRRGCTLIVDPLRREVRYAIATRGDVTDDKELERVRQFLLGRAGVAGNPFYGASPEIDEDSEHFAALHRHEAAPAEF